MIASALIYVVAVPLLVASVAAMVARRMGAAPRVEWAVGVGFGYVAGHLGLKSQGGIGSAIGSFVRPLEARDWVPHAVLLAMAVTILTTRVPHASRRWIPWAAALLTVGVPIRLLSGHVAQELSAMEKISYLALLSATLGLVWLLLEMAGDDDQPVLRSALVALVAAGSAIVIATTSLVGGESCGMVACSVAGAGLVLLWRGRPSGFDGAAAVITFSLGSLIVLGRFYAELPAATAALMLVALALAGGPMPQTIRTGSGWFDAAVRALLCSIPLVVAIVGSLS